MKAQTWIVHVNPSILGPLVVKGRPKGGSFRPARRLPAGLRQYLTLPDDVAARPVMQDVAGMEELDALALDENLLRVTARGHARILTITLPDWAQPRTQRRKTPTVPKNVRAVRTLAQLCRYFGADSPRGLNRRIYKDTACGASISLLLKDGTTWLHNGAAGWDTLTTRAKILGFTLQTIVEGSDAVVESDTFYLPVRESEIAGWMADMEREADELWHAANDGDELYDEKGGQ